MNEWMSGKMNLWMREWVNKRIDEWMIELINEFIFKMKVILRQRVHVGQMK